MLSDRLTANRFSIGRKANEALPLFGNGSGVISLEGHEVQELAAFLAWIDSTELGLAERPEGTRLLPSEWTCCYRAT
jgi:hypothetical protein